MRNYLRLILFSMGLLAGVQIPGWLELYYQRVDARLQQAETSLAPFQANADEHFGGALDALITHYRSNPDPVVNRDADSIQQLVAQRERLTSEQALHSALWFKQLTHLLLRGDRALIEDTLTHYNYVVPLNQDAMTCGLLVALLAALLGDLFFSLLAWPFKPSPRRRPEFR